MEQDNKEKSAAPLIWVGALVAMVVGLWLGNMAFRDKPVALPADLQATAFPAPRSIRTFSLLDQDGKPFTPDNLKGHWSYLFFGYTHCPDVCPTTLSTLNAAVGELNRSKGEHPPLSVYFVSVDPARDTPEQLARFVPYFNGEFTGITGTPENIDEFSKHMGVLHTRAAAEKESGNYLVDHTASIFLLNPDGHLVAITSPPFDAKTIAREFLAITHYWNSKK